MNSFINDKTNTLPECISAKEVCQWLGIARSTIFNYIKEGHFPKPVKLSNRRHIFLKSEVVTWFENRQIADNQTSKNPTV